MIEPVPRSVSGASAQSADGRSLAPRLHDALSLVRAEYLEMPGLGLTLPQVARFFTLTPQESAELLSVLVGEGILTRDDRGAYRRRW